MLALHANSAITHPLLRQSAIAVLYFDDIGNLITANAKAQQLLRLPADAGLQELFLSNFFTKESRNWIVDSCVPLLRQHKEVPKVQWQFNIADFLQLRVMVEVIADDAPESCGNFWMLLTEPETVKTSETQFVDCFEDMFFKAPVSLVFSNMANGKTVAVNQAFADVVGVLPADLVGKAASQFYADPASYEQMVAEVKENGAVNQYEVSCMVNEREVKALLSCKQINWKEIPHLLHSFTVLSVKEKNAEEDQQASITIEALTKDITNGTFTVNKNWTITRWNEAADSMQQEPKINVVGKSLWDIFPEESAPEFHRQFCAAMDKRRVAHFDAFYPVSGKWYRVSAYPLAFGLLVYFSDVSDNYLLQALSQAEQELLVLTAKAGSRLPEVIGHFVTKIQQLSPQMICSVLQVKDNKLHNWASPDLPEAYVQAVNGLEVGDNVGSCGTAAFTRKKIVVSSIATDPKWKKYKHIALAHGLQSCWSYPIINSNGDVLGTFALYYRTEKLPNANDELIIERACRLLLIIIENKQAEETLMNLNNELAAERHLLRTIIDNVPVNIYVKDKLGRKILANRAEYQYVGANAEIEAIRANMESFFALETAELFSAIDKRVIHTKEPVLNEECLVFKKDGSQDTLLISEIPMLNSADDVDLLIGISYNITDRKKLENELLSQKEQLQLALNVAGMGQWVYDMAKDAYTHSHINLHLMDMDLDKAHCQLADLKERVHPEDLELIRQSWQRSIEGKMPLHIDHRIILRNGQIRWLNVQAIIDRDKDGRPLLIRGVSQDITERKNAIVSIQVANEVLEQKVISRTADLIQSQHLLHEAQQMANMGSWVLDVTAMTLAWSPQMYKLTGFDFKDDVADFFKYSANFAPTEWDKILQLIKQSLLEKKQYETKTRFIKSDGESRAAIVRCRPILDTKGNVTHLLGMVHDITELLIFQKQIEDQRFIFHAILEQSLAGYWDFNFSSNSIIMSDGYKAMLGYAPQEIGNTMESWKALIFQEDRGRLEQAMLNHIASKGATPFNEEVRYVHKNGNILWIICKGAVIEWDGETPVRAVGCQIDITRQKQTELNLEKNRRELESFSYSVSHDLRAPLRGIDGWSLALEEDFGHLLNETGKTYIARVRSEAQRMGNLIDDLLKISQINQVKINPVTFDLTPLAQSVAGRLLQLHQGRDIRFSIAPQLKIAGDKNMLEILLTNLMENAVKFTSKMPVALIRLYQQPIADGGAFVLQDNGAGFDMASAKKLFGAFQRFHHKSDFEGSGIGLATVQRIVNLHGGRIWAQSEPGKGASFYFIV